MQTERYDYSAIVQAQAVQMAQRRAGRAHGGA